MPQKPLTIVPVTLDSTPNDSLSAVTSKSPGSCTIHFGHAEVTFRNGVEERIIQTVIRELIHR